MMRVDWGNIVGKFEMHMMSLAHNTQLQYFNSLKIICRNFEHMPFASITSAEIERFKAEGVKAGRARSSAGCYYLS